MMHFLTNFLIYIFLNFICITSLFGQCMPYKVIERIKRGAPDWVLKQIESDLSSISPEDISPQALDAAMAERAYGELLLVRYIIRDGYLHIHSTTPGLNSSGRYEQFTRYLNEVVKACRDECKIPDCDFIVSMHDAFSHAENLKTAVLAFAKNRHDLNVILVPDTEVLSSAENLHVETNNGNAAFPWDQKVEKAVWRGATTGPITLENYKEYPRFQLIGISLNHPEWVDARFTDLCQGTQYFYDHISQYFGSKISVADHMRYKYQILVDGNSCAYTRAYWQLFSNSAIVKHESDHVQWYYGAYNPMFIIFRRHRISAI